MLWLSHGVVMVIMWLCYVIKGIWQCEYGIGVAMLCYFGYVPVWLQPIVMLLQLSAWWCGYSISVCILYYGYANR